MSLSGLSKECRSARCGADSGKILAAGMDDILPKPVTIDALREMIERVRMPPRAA
jgi:CheY-like chemotaxis protein